MSRDGVLGVIDRRVENSEEKFIIAIWCMVILCTVKLLKEFLVKSTKRNYE